MFTKLHSISEITGKTLKILSGRQKKQSIGTFVAIIIASLLELLGVTIIVPFIMAIMNPELLLNNKYMLFFTKLLGMEETDASSMLIILGTLLILIYIVKNVGLLCSRYVQNRYQVNLQKEISVMMMESYLKHPYEYFVNTNSAEILRGIDADVCGFAIIINMLFSCLAEFLTMFLIVGFVLTTDFLTSIGLLTVALACVLIIVFGCKNIMSRTGIKYREAIAKRYKWACQTVDGIKEIFVMQKKSFFLREYEKAYEEYSAAMKIYTFINSIPERLTEVMVVGGIVAIVCFRIIQGYPAEQYIPQLAGLAVACFRLLPSLNKLTTCTSQIVYNRPSLDAVYNNIMEAREFADKSVGKNDANGGREQLTFYNEIEMRDITWRYLHGDRNILEHLSFKIQKGESVAIIGESGAGKTTLADIVMGLLQPQDGGVCVDGKAIDGNCFQWARMIGYVPQNVYLIDDTIRNNVAFGIPEEEIKDAAVWEALKQASLDDYVRTLPGGLDTIVGERGIKFSGGQRQRIAIARTMYYDPEILVLDEATSALDDGTEKAVMESIDSLQGKKTLIIIAHRLSTIEKCDRIYEVVNNTVIEREKSDVLK